MSVVEPFPRVADTDGLVAQARASMSKNFRQAPVVFVRGEGCYLWDREGQRYLDFVSGLAVMALGHSHPAVVEATMRQSRLLFHVSNLYYNEPQILLSVALAARFGEGRVFLCNSGTEANEAALKLARRWATVRRGEPNRTGFVSFEHSFHGRTFGGLSVTGQPRYHAGFEPILPGCRYARFNDLESVAALVDDSTCAVIAEPILAEGGILLPEPGFLASLGELCRERGALLILDEIQTGCGRTGTFFAFEQEGVRPDIVTLAKALGGGLPVGAMISTEAVADGFEPGSHGSTFAGNAVVARAALAVLEVMEEDGLLAHVTRTSKILEAGLQGLVDRFDFVEVAAGRGYIWRLSFTQPLGERVVAECMKRGLLVNRLSPTSIRILPPLIAQRSHMEAALGVLEEVLADLARSQTPDGAAS